MVIRRVPTDFIVEELLADALRAQIAPAPRSPHSQAVYTLEKTSLSTPEAVQHLARQLSISPGKLAYAGLKDKHAQTTQHISVPLATKTPELSPRTVKGAGWSASLLGWIENPINAAAIAANRFIIIVRDMTTADAREMDRRRVLLADGDSLLIINYFGDQRFGSARHGHGFAAKLLLKGDFDTALRLLIATPARKDSGKRRTFTRTAAAGWGDWKTLAATLPRCPDRRPIEVLASGQDARAAFSALPYFQQTIAVEAYQSFLWNQTARAIVTRHCSDGIRADDDFGEMIFPPSTAITAAWRSASLPMFASTTTPDPLWADAAAEVLAGESISFTDLRIPGLRRPEFREAPRPFLVAAGAFTISDPEPDNLRRPGRLKRTLRFDLPRGAYATVVLRALGQ